MVPDAKKNPTSALTGFADGGADAAERLAHLERDRWPEFERELRLRRPRKCHFDCHHYGAERQPWEWLLWRCRSWTEVERVLNRHRADWRQGRGEILLDGMTIFRCQ